MLERVSSRLARLFSSALEDKHLGSSDGRLAGRREGALRCQLERALTVRETCRPQGRDLHDYLLAAITAALHGQPPPSLLPSGP